jgi:hypothetical protein
MKYVILVTLLFTASFLAAQEGRDKDGHFHDPETGEIQPDHCDNSFKNEHPCTCNHADDKCDHDTKKEHPTRLCKTWCRTDACGCANHCGS